MNRAKLLFAVLLLASSISVVFLIITSNYYEEITLFTKNYYQECQTGMETTSGIQYPLGEKIKNTKMYKTFNDRNHFLKRSCKFSKSIYSESPQWTHAQRLQFQHQLIDPNHCMTEESECIPALPKLGGKLEHFYNDTFKFSVCLPTKTGSSNWLRGLSSLIKMGNPPPEEVAERDIWYGVDRFPKESDDLKKFRESRTPANGYMTMITVRHPLARLYSAWKDKFRKNHPWMKVIEKLFGTFLKDLESHNMAVEQYEYSFEAFLELVAATDFDFQRDRHWQTYQYYCGTCNFDYDFIVHQENANAENSFILSAMKVKKVVPNIHIPGKYGGSVTTESMLEPYRNISLSVMENIYKNYYSDFVYFNYTMDDAFKLARMEDSDEIIQTRAIVRTEIAKKFIAYQRRSNDGSCEVPTYDFYSDE